MYDAGQVNAPPWDGSHEQHDPEGAGGGGVDNIVLADMQMAMCLMDSVTWTGAGMHIGMERSSNDFHFQSFLSSMEAVRKSFIASFGKVCVHYEFSEQDMVEWLHLCLRGKAQSYETSLSYEIQNNYDGSSAGATL